MTRAAGTSHAYSWKLKGVRRGLSYEIHLPSVTHIIKVPKDEMGFGGMAWWGWKLGLKAAYPDASDAELDDIVEEMKTGPVTPNKVRDAAGERGDYAHNMLEKVALDQAVFYLDADSVFHFIEEGKKPVRLQEWGEAAARWWFDNMDLQEIVFSERPVWHLGYGYTGTLDLARLVKDDPQDEEPLTFEIVDYKTHKPADGMRKDGSYAEGKGPGYTEDLAQLQGYAMAVEAMALNPNAPVYTRVVLLGQDGQYHEDTRQVADGLFMQFKAMHDVMCRKPSCVEMARMYNGGR